MLELNDIRDFVGFEVLTAVNLLPSSRNLRES